MAPHIIYHVELFDSLEWFDSWRKNLILPELESVKTILLINMMIVYNLI